MKNTDNIEKLFKETFENFETDVNPQAWANVQSGINSGAGSAASAAAKFAIGKIIAGAATAAVVAGSAWYFLQPENKTNSSPDKDKTVTVSNETSQPVISENNSPGNFSGTTADKQTVSTDHSLNQNTAGSYRDGNSLPTQGVSGSSDKTFSTDVSENTATASSQPAHKYGKSSDAPSSMMRGNQVQHTNSNSSTDAPSTDNQEAETSPSAIIFASAESGNAPLTVAFSNQGTSAPLSWDFGDGSVSRELFPSHTFEKPGTYAVKLSLKNAAGSSSDKITIEVKPVSEITYIPNIFTPNGDGENDLFILKLKNIASIGVVLYSQKNGTVCSWNTLDGSWDGKLLNGENAPQGVYFYSIRAIGTDFVEYSQKGFVELKR